MNIKILYIGNRLASKGITASSIDTLAALFRKEGMIVRSASSSKNKAARLWDMLLTTYKNRSWVEVVLIDTYSTSNFWYAIAVGRLCRFLNLKYIPILHGGNLPQRLESNPKLIKSFLENAHKVVSPSGYLKHAFAKAGFHNIQVVPNSIELENYQFKQRSSLQPNLLWVRSFADIYNPMMALQVLEDLKTIFPQAQLTMVGPEKDGSMHACKSWAETRNLNVKFTGLLTKKEWTKLAVDHNIFINTARFDNMPVSLLEAMALGLPVISTNVGGIPFMIQDRVNGILVPDSDALSMILAIKELIETPQLGCDISINAKTYVEKLDWSHIKRLWNNLLAD